MNVPLIYLTVFEFAEMVAKLRVAQKAFADLQSEYRRAVLVSAEYNVDGTLEHIRQRSCTQELIEYAGFVTEMRTLQKKARVDRSQALVGKVRVAEAQVDALNIAAARAGVLLNQALKAANASQIPERRK